MNIDGNYRNNALLLSTPPRKQNNQQQRLTPGKTRMRLTPSFDTTTPFLTPIRSTNEVYGHYGSISRNITGDRHKVITTPTTCSSSRNSTSNNRLLLRSRMYNNDDDDITTRNVSNTSTALTSNTASPSRTCIVNRLVRTPNHNRYLQSSSSNKRREDTSGTTISTPFYTPRQHQQTPSTSSLDYSHQDDDRFIPSRRNMNIELCRRSLLSGEKKRTATVVSSTSTSSSLSDDSSSGSGAPVATAAERQETPIQKEFKRRMLSTLCNVPLYMLDEDACPKSMLAFGDGDSSFSMNTMSSNGYNSENVAPIGNNRNNNSHRNKNCGVLTSIVNPFSLDTLRSSKMGYSTSFNNINTETDPFLLGIGGGAVPASKVLRKVPNAPVRILDAPDIVDDYYLNLISWSKDGILAVALARSVYLWNSTSGDIQHLVTVQGVDYITSVSWCSEPGQTKYIAVGTHLNSVHIFDGIALSKVRTMDGATGRIASLSWNNTHHFVSAGDRDSCIINHDIRTDNHIVSKYRGHTQEVCGLKWNDDGTCLASGGNENYLCLWDVAMSSRTTNRTNRNTNTDETSSTDHNPRFILKQHKAAVKALDWCPFHRGLLASGGGTADRSIKFWNSNSGVMLNTIDTGSQVCSLLWSRHHHRELCSSHGYSENQLILWKYPGMTKVKELTGHTARVLNMDMSPDGSSVVSAGADETLRFWNLFDSSSGRRNSVGGIHLGELSFGGPTIR